MGGERARGLATLAILAPLTSLAGPLVAPLPFTATLCEEAGANCRSAYIPAGTDLREFLRSIDERPLRLRIVLPPGRFDLASTWTIDGAALPKPVVSLSISGSPPGTRLTGALDILALGRPAADPDGALSVELPRALRTELASVARYSADDPAWPQLFDAQGALPLARWPRTGWAAFEQPTERGTHAATPNTIFMTDAPLPDWRRESALWVSGFFRYGWHAEHVRLAGIDTAARRLRLPDTRVGIGNSGRLRVINLRSAMSAGESWIDFTRGRIAWRPRAESAIGLPRLTVLSTPLLAVRNAGHVDIRALAFAQTRGHGIVVERSHDVTLSALTFEDIGRAGLVVDGGRNVQIRDSEFRDLGDQAIVLRGGDRATLAISGHRVEGCRIRRASRRLNTPATAIRLEGVGHVVKDNWIEDLPHSAVYFDGNDHRIEGNWIERVCLDVEDAGAIYAGRDWTARGARIMGNVFSKVIAARPGGTAVGVYLDDMLSGTRVEGNAFVDTNVGVLVGGGRDNLIAGNLFHRVGVPIHIDDRARHWVCDAVAPGGIMDQRLDAMPVRGAKWSDAYPRLARMPRERAADPEGNEIRDNVAAESGPPSLVRIAVETGSIEAPRIIALPDTLASAAELLAVCETDARCRPFVPSSAHP